MPDGAEARHAAPAPEPVPDLAPAPADESAVAEASQARDLRFNFTAILVHGLLGQTGFRLVQAPTFLPHFVSLLSDSHSAVGIVRAVQSLGQFLSPVISARIIERRTHAKRLGVIFGSVMRAQILLLGLTALFAPREHALWLVWLAVGLLGLALGMQGVAFNFVLSKTIPAERRGILLGIRETAGGAALLVVSLLGGYLIDRYGFPDGYGYTFLAGFLLTSGGLFAFAAVREPASPERRERERFGTRMLEVGTLFGAEVDFRRFMLARLLGTAARGALPLYVVYVGEQFGLSGARLAGLTIFFTVAQSGLGLLWGIVADRRGYRSVFAGALGCWAAGTLLLLVSSRIELAYVVFLLVGTGVGGFMIASQNLVLEFGGEGNLPMRIATSNSLSELVGMLAFLAAGFAADLVPMQWVFAASAALHGLAILQIRRIRDPRAARRSGA
jgi:MFS family permease